MPATPEGNLLIESGAYLYFLAAGLLGLGALGLEVSRRRAMKRHLGHSETHPIATSFDEAERWAEAQPDRTAEIVKVKPGEPGRTPTRLYLGKPGGKSS